MHRSSDSVSLNRWKTARRVVLGAILLAGSMATTAAAVQRMAVRSQVVQTVSMTEEVYSGIGVSIVERRGQVYVSQVSPHGPAMDQIYPGARLVSVDGEQPTNIIAWRDMLRGEVGTSLELQVAYRCGGTQTLTLERELIVVRD